MEEGLGLRAGSHRQSSFIRPGPGGDGKMSLTRQHF